MPATALERLRAIPNLTVRVNEPLAPYTRFQIGGPAALFCDTADRVAFLEALAATDVRYGIPRMIIGGGTNLVVSGSGFDGVLLRYTGSHIAQSGNRLRVEAGAVLQDVVDSANRLGLEGLQTMTGIPGYLGGAIYGNAGAYGRSIQEIVESVEAYGGGMPVTFANRECNFRYRESAFKDSKDLIILSAELRFEAGDPAALNKTSREIRAIRDAKYPPAMKCAGSIFKNLLLAELPARAKNEIPANVIREGKVPSAWFLEQVGAKGIRRGDIQVASYHANLIYNDGTGSADDLVAIIQDLKHRVRQRFAIDLEEEIQYVGFDYVETAA